MSLEVHVKSPLESYFKCLHTNQAMKDTTKDFELHCKNIPEGSRQISNLDSPSVTQI